MNVYGCIAYAAAFIAVAWALSRGFLKGLGVGLALLVAMPDSLRIPAGLFDLTIQRCIIVLLFARWLFLPRTEKTDRPAAFLPLVLCVGLCQLVSLLQSTTFASSFKALLAFAIEICLFYGMVARSIRDLRTGLWLIRCVCFGISGAAVFAWCQKYAGFNVREFMGAPLDPLAARDVIGTFSHRIMLGHAMAMAIPLLVGMLVSADSKPERRRYGLGLLLVMGACYFATSRGPWLAAGLAVMGLAALGTRGTRRSIILIAVAGAALMAVRPGVWGTISDLGTSTFESNTLKGESYEYRWKLWGVAWAEIGKSPLRLLFGYGGLSHEKMDLSADFDKKFEGTAAVLGYTSFDNNFACDLLEFGLVGFAAEMVLYLMIVRRLFSIWRASGPQVQDMTAANMAGCMVFLMANAMVYIFSPQVKCLFWALVAIGTSTVWNPDTEHDASETQSASEAPGGRPAGFAAMSRRGLLAD